MIDIYKIINGIYDKNATQFLKLWKDMEPCKNKTQRESQNNFHTKSHK